MESTKRVRRNQRLGSLIAVQRALREARQAGEIHCPACGAPVAEGDRFRLHGVAFHHACLHRRNADFARPDGPGGAS